MFNSDIFKTTALSTSLVLALGVAPVAAQNMMDQDRTGTTNEGQQFETFDRNNDGQMNNQEFATYTYYTVDNDNDNMISEEEWNDYTNIWYGPLDNVNYDDEMTFSDYDANNNGYIETSEFVNAYDTDLYSSWDMDNDGFIETAEYDEMTTTYYDYDSNDVYIW